MKFFALSSCALVACCAVSAQTVTDPHITTWLTSRSGQYARIYQTSSDKSAGTTSTTWPRSGLTNSGGGQATVAYADVQRVAYSNTYVYIYTTGLASYTMGNWLNPQGNTFQFWPTNRAAIHRIPRTPSIPTTKSKANGVGGVWLNGVYLWENGDAQSYSTSSATVSFNGDGIWNRLAGVAEAFNFDSGNGHQPNSGAYHTHINPIALRYQLGDNVSYNSSTKTYSEATPTKHSPLLGWALDGLPIYGPYGYSTATDATSGIRRMTSGFQKRDGTNGSTNLSSTGRHTLPVWAASVQGKSQTLSSSEYGPNVNSTYPLGTFAEDYDYMGDLGKTQGTDFDLNRQNVRYCVTPEYPSGTYAYFVSIDSSGTTYFPDVINQEFYGSIPSGPSGNQGTVTSITESVTEYVDAGPAGTITLTGTASGGGVQLSWNSAEGATYKVESSANNSTWTTESSAVTSAGTTTTYTTASSSIYYRVTLTAIATYDTGGTYGTAVGKTATLQYGTPLVAPSITTQPSNVTVTAGASASFTVAASGSAPLTYQWQKGGSNLSGATTATYSIAATSTSDAGSYACVVTNSVSSVTSTAATLTVNPAPVAPSITSQPANLTLSAGASASFSITASGTAPLSYQWQKGGTAISGATAATYTIASAQLSDAGSFACVVSNSVGNVTSNAATLVVNAAAPAITTQPANVTVTVGASASFTIAASGTAPLSYQWQKAGSSITGATAATYTISSSQLSDAGSFACVVSNSVGNVTSNTATLTVNAAPPSISTQPAAASALVGGNVSFSVAATGTAPLTYQWYKGVTTISGATNATLALTNVQLTDAGSYSAVVTNSAGSATSNGAALTVTAPAVAPAITTQPVSVSVKTGDAASFTVAASGTAPLTYQWKKGASSVASGTAATYTIASAQAGDAGAYSCVVTNSAGTATSNAATLTVSAAAVAPSFASQPANVTASVGSSASFSVVANGTGPLSYQWWRAGNAIAGATNATYTIAAVTSGDAGSYTCTVVNSVGNATSNPATLTVSVAPVAPSVTQQPTDATVSQGASASFSITASGTAPLTYQWYKGVTAISGATNTTLTFASAQPSDAGSYLCVVTNSAGAATSSSGALTVNASSGSGSGSGSDSGGSTGGGDSTGSTSTGPLPARLVNLSVRTQVGGASGNPVIGFAVDGAGTGKKVMIRAVGPTLSTFGLTGVLADPQLQLWSGGTTLASNDNWDQSVASYFAPVSAFPLVRQSADAVLVQTVSPGTYSTPVSGGGGSSGVVLLECYDLTSSDLTTKLVNASALARVGSGDDVLIVGFVVAGDTGTVKLLIRAVGPQLFAYGIRGELQDPQLTVFQGSSVVAQNDNWATNTNAAEIATAASKANAFPLPDTGKDSAVLLTLGPGLYSAVASGVGGQTGTGLVEFYVVP